MSVYLAFEDADHEAHSLTAEEEEAGVEERYPHPGYISMWEGPVPRVGEFVLREGHWWEVLVVAYTSMSPYPPEIDAWVDLVVRLIDHDPREVTQ